MKFKKHLFNKYFLAGILFVVYMLFFDQHSIKNHLRISDQITQAEGYRDYYQKKIEEESKYLYKLTNNPKEIERIAREKYYMKKRDEEVFVIKKVNQN